MLQSRVPSTCVPVPSRSLIHQINQGKRRDSFNAIEKAKAAGHVKRQSPYINERGTGLPTEHV